MILIGQYDSPFVRRVAIAMKLYGRHYEHWPWSTFGDAQKLAAYNPLRRVPTLVLDDGQALIESATILDHLDECADPGRRLIATAGDERRAALKTCALATGLCDKTVSLFYENIMHDETSSPWVARCETQIDGVRDALEADRARCPTLFWFGERPGHADIAAACAWRFLAEALPALHRPERWPGLAAHAAACEDLDAFRAVVQPFAPPKP